MSHAVERPRSHRPSGPRGLWGSSLPLRVIVTTLGASVLVLVLGGWMLLQNASRGIVDAKMQASSAEATTALQRMQNQLDDTDLRTESLLERLGQLADEVGTEPGQFKVIIEASATVYMSRDVLPASVPESLREQLADEPESVFVTPADIKYADGNSTAGVAVGGCLIAPSGQTFPVYFLFPADQEIQTILALRGALYSTGALLIVALAVIAYLVSHQVTVPIRQARDVAGRIAAGDLDQRLEVRGTDELASLATSMNNMAGELQRQISRLEDLSRVQQQFVSDVSHELRTPLTTMRMAAEVLYESRDGFSPDHQRTTELLHDQVDRFESMLTDLLEISRFDAGAAVLSADEVDVWDVVEQEVAAESAVAEQMGSRITLHKMGATTVEGDVRRIQRIVRNLLSNAIGLGEGRPIVIDVAGDEDAVAVTVRDHGVGFEPSQSQMVFHRFWRADESRNRVGGGTGLGLAISIEDARLHRGWLEAWGRPGEGAQFRLTLPRTQDVVLEDSPLPLEPRDAPGGPARQTTGGTA